jgi:hypothetical protein
LVGLAKFLCGDPSKVFQEGYIILLTFSAEHVREKFSLEPRGAWGEMELFILPAGRRGAEIAPFLIRVSSRFQFNLTFLFLISPHFPDRKGFQTEYGKNIIIFFLKRRVVTLI